MIYDYSGYCIVTIRPADDKAILLEFQEGTKVETEENEFDNIFLDMLGERNAVDTSEFDGIFGEDLKPKEQIKTEFDDIFR